MSRPVDEFGHLTDDDEWQDSFDPTEVPKDMRGCEHGHVANSCTACYEEQRIADLEHRLKAAEAELADVIKARDKRLEEYAIEHAALRGRIHGGYMNWSREKELKDQLAAMTAERDALRQRLAFFEQGPQAIYCEIGYLEDKLAAGRMSHFWSVVGWIGAHARSTSDAVLFNEALFDMRDQRDAAIARAEKAEAALIGCNVCNSDAPKYGCEHCCQRSVDDHERDNMAMLDLIGERDAANANAAALREYVIELSCKFSTNERPHRGREWKASVSEALLEQGQAALASNAGSDLLTRLKVAEAEAEARRIMGERYADAEDWRAKLSRMQAVVKAARVKHGHYRSPPDCEICNALAALDNANGECIEPLHDHHDGCPAMERCPVTDDEGGDRE